MPADTCLIYGLVSSAAPDEIRYIGKTTLAQAQRLRLHIYAAQKHRKARVHRWICEEMGAGHAIQMVPLKESASYYGDEESFIAAYRERGARLVNTTKGGQGAPGFRWSDAMRKAAAERSKGRTLSLDARMRISAKLKGVKLSDATRARMSASRQGERNHFFGKSHDAKAKEANGRARAKLTDEQVRELHARFVAGEKQRDLAVAYGISQAQVSGIVNGATYAWLGLGKARRGVHVQAAA